METKSKLCIYIYMLWAFDMGADAEDFLQQEGLQPMASGYHSKLWFQIRML